MRHYDPYLEEQYFILHYIKVIYYGILGEDLAMQVNGEAVRIILVAVLSMLLEVLGTGVALGRPVHFPNAGPVQKKVYWVLVRPCLVDQTKYDLVLENTDRSCTRDVNSEHVVAFGEVREHFLVRSH